MFVKLGWFIENLEYKWKTRGAHTPWVKEISSPNHLAVREMTQITYKVCTSSIIHQCGSNHPIII